MTSPQVEEKKYRAQAGKHIQYLKQQGLSYQWIEHRMGRSENWAMRVAEEGALTTQGELDYLHAIVQAVKTLPKPKPQNYKHRAVDYIKNKDVGLNPKTKLAKNLALAGQLAKKVAPKKK